VDALLGVEPRPALRRHLHETTQGPAVLFVGQILPHKAIERLVLAFHVLVTYLAPDAHLFLVGPKRTEAYAATLLRLIGSLCLAQVAMPGKVPAEDLAAYYERADLFVTLSRHEGFCIPLVEAMAFDVPIVASDAAAIPETLGGAGLLVPAKASPTFVAETMASVLTDGPLRRHLVERGRRRLADFPSKQLEDHFLEVALGAYRP
jgi:glycosyltransferase involved in cell wall biosynthesis